MNPETTTKNTTQTINKTTQTLNFMAQLWCWSSIHFGIPGVPFVTPAHRSWIVFFDGRSNNLKRIDFGRCSRLQVYIYHLGSTSTPKTREFSYKPTTNRTRRSPSRSLWPMLLFDQVHEQPQRAHVVVEEGDSALEAVAATTAESGCGFSVSSWPG